jgi:hypothetical protein
MAGALGEAARALGLGHELRAVAAAEAQARRRAEQVAADAVQPGTELGEHT